MTTESEFETENLSQDLAVEEPPVEFEMDEILNPQIDDAQLSFTDPNPESQSLDDEAPVFDNPFVPGSDDVVNFHENKIIELYQKYGDLPEIDEEVDIDALAEEIGAPRTLVEFDPKLVSSEFNKIKVQETLQNSPILRTQVIDDPSARRYINDPKEIEKLSWFESVKKQIDKDFSRGQLSAEYAQLTFKMMKGEASRIEIERVRELQQIFSTPDETGNFFSPALEALGALSSGFPKVAGKFGIGAGFGAGASLASGPGAAVTAVPAALFGGSALAMEEIAQQGFVFASGPVWLELVDAGVDPKIAKTAAEGIGATSGLLDAVGVGIFLKPFKNIIRAAAFKKLIKSLKNSTTKAGAEAAVLTYFKIVLKESGIEGTQQAIEISGKEAAKQADETEFESRFSTPEGLKSILAEVGEAIKQGAQVAAVFGAGTVIPASIRKQVESTRSFLDELREVTTKSEYAKNNPETLRDFINDVHSDSTVANFYIDKKIIKSFLEKIDADQNMIENLKISDQLNDRKNPKGKVKLSIGAYAAFIAGDRNWHKELREHIALSENGMTFAEEVKFIAQQPESKSKSRAPEASIKVRDEIEITKVGEKTFDSLDAAMDWANANVRNTYLNIHLNREINVFSKGIEQALRSNKKKFNKKSKRFNIESKKKQQANINAVLALPNLVENAIWVKRERDRNGDPKVKWVHKYVAPLELLGKLFIADITIKERQQGHFLHDMSLLELKDDTKAKSFKNEMVGPQEGEKSPSGAIIKSQSLLEEHKKIKEAKKERAMRTK